MFFNTRFRISKLNYNVFTLTIRKTLKFMQFLLYKPYSFLSDIFAVNVFLYLYHYHLQKEIVKSAVILLF